MAHRFSPTRQLAIVCAVLAICGPLQAADRGTAVVYTCQSDQSCSDTGKCIDGAHKATMIETKTWTGAQTQTEVFAAITVLDAGAGTMYLTTAQTLTQTPGSLAEFATSNLAERALFQDPFAAFDNEGMTARYYVARPASEVSGLRGGSVVSRFRCSQVLF